MATRDCGNAKQNSKGVLKMGKQWHFEKYAVYEESCDRTLRFENTDGNVLGYVVAGDNADHHANVEALDGGVDPIKAQWEDGAGNTVSLHGWGDCYLKAPYAAWRKASEEMLEDGFSGSVDCGETAVRIDFSNFAELGYTIDFEEIFELEKDYENQ